MSHRVSQRINWTKVMNRVLVKMIGSESVIWMTGRSLDSHEIRRRSIWWRGFHGRCSDAWLNGALITGRNDYAELNGIHGQIPARMLIIGVRQFDSGMSMRSFWRETAVSVGTSFIKAAKESHTLINERSPTLKINGAFMRNPTQIYVSSYYRV